MKNEKIVYDNEEWVDTPLTKEESQSYAQNAAYTKSLLREDISLRNIHLL